MLLILNGPAYDSDETYNALRLAEALDGYYTLDRMLRTVARHGGHVACCGTCLDARGLTGDHLVDEASRSTMGELACWTVEADQVLTL